MNHQSMMMTIPDLQPEELAVLNELMQGLDERQKEQLIMFYRTKRKDKQTMILLAAIGFLGVAGVHRFIIGDIALGILYIFTLGFCFIGTIIDIVNIGQMTNDFNRKQAVESANLVRMMSR
ncbi:MAG: NINE protein [Chitinophagaceae bacterium]|nr:NINE protein [Chitinophagaceae bacterium]